MRANAVPLDEKNPDGKTRRDDVLRTQAATLGFALLWERACSRRRSDIQHRCRLIHRFREQARSHIQNNCVNNQYRLPDSRIAAGNVSTQAISRLRMVFICKPPPLATMVPATPEDNT